MTFIGKIYLLGILLLLAGCSMAPVKLKGHEFESSNLSETMADRLVAFKSSYDSRYDGCATIRDANKFERAVSAWAPKQVEWARRTSDNVNINYAWACDDVYKDFSGFTTFLSLLSLGILPHSDNLRLRLHVSIDHKGKYIFKGDYESNETVWMSPWFDEDEEYFGKVADVLIERFIIELDRDGVLEL